MLSDQPYDRRKFLTNLSMAGALTLGLSELVNAAGKSTDSFEKQLTRGELSSLSRANSWLNTDKLNPSELKGKVVLINFCTYTCINWLRQLPYVREWYNKYKDEGLVVVGVHTPEFSFEHNLTNVNGSFANLNVGYPVAIDNDRIIWNAFNNNYWPAIYILDGKGKIRHQQFGEGGYEDCERVIQQLLTKPGTANLNNDLVSPDGKAIEAPADWPNLKSSENYLGEARTENFVSVGKAPRKGRKLYPVPGILKLNQWSLSGEWVVKDESITLQQTGGSIVCQFHARDLHLVMGPSTSGQSISFKVLIDGEVPGFTNGTDVDGNGVGVVTEQRLYQLIRQQTNITSRRFEILFLDPAVEAFAFTFG